MGLGIATTCKDGWSPPFWTAGGGRAAASFPDSLAPQPEDLLSTIRTKQAPRRLSGRWTRCIARVAPGGRLGRQTLNRAAALEVATLYAGHLAGMAAEMGGASKVERAAARRRAARMAGRRMARHYYTGVTVDLVRSLAAAWVGLAAAWVGLAALPARACSPRQRAA